MKRKRFAAALILIFLLAAGGAAGENTPRPCPPETPAPVKTARPVPEPTPEMPAVIDRVTDPAAGDGFRFMLDAKILHIWFPNIMNADEAILMYDGDVWLIDCGDERAGSRGAELIRLLGIEKIGKLFNTHPHHDHLNGLTATHEAAPVRELLICFPADSTDHMIRAIRYAEMNGIRVSEFRDGSSFAMGDGAVTLTFYVNPPEGLDMNNQSAVTMVRCGRRTMLFTADMEIPGQARMMERLQPETLDADVLKYPHHGKSAMDESFFAAVSPDAAVVTNKTVAEWNGIRYLAGKGIPFFYTNRTGMYLHLMTDGEHWIAEYVRPEEIKGAE